MDCRIIEHTADVGIEITADGLDELFEGAAAGMYSLISDPADVRQTLEIRVRIQAGDVEELMFEWLNELLYLSDSRSALFSGFEVTGVEDLEVRATVRGEGIDPGRHKVNTEVKAATYHGLGVTREGGTFRATIIFDV